MCGTGSASEMFPFDVDSLRLQLARCQTASCSIDGTVRDRATLCGFGLHWQSQCHTYLDSLLVGNQQAVASMERFATERPCAVSAYTGRASATLMSAGCSRQCRECNGKLQSFARLFETISPNFPTHLGIEHQELSPDFLRRVDIDSP